MMVTTPLSTPPTSATSSAPAPQSPATEDHRLDAAPVPKGSRQMKTASRPMRPAAMAITSRAASFRVAR